MFQVLEELDKNAIYDFWEVCLLYENEAWWGEMNSSSLPAIPVSREYFEVPFFGWKDRCWCADPYIFPRYSDPLADIHRGMRSPRVVQADLRFLPTRV